MVQKKEWKTVRPWLPPAGSSESSSPSHDPSPDRNTRELSLEMVDISSTSITLIVTIPLPVLYVQNRPPEPTIAVTVDGGAWGFVYAIALEYINALGETIPVSELGNQGISGTRSTITIYNLEEGREYEIALRAENTCDFVETVESDRVGRDRSLSDSSADSHDEPPPPPYSEPPAAQTTPAALKTLLKTLRANSKSTEQSLQTSISSLRKTLEKSSKEDQRLRSRIVELEDGIRKIRLSEEEVKQDITHHCEKKKRLEEELQESCKFFESRKSALAARKKEDLDDGDESSADNSDIPTLTRELADLTKQYAQLEAERKRRVKEELRKLETELGEIDGELIRLDRLEQQKLHISPDPMSHYPYGNYNHRSRSQSLLTRSRSLSGASTLPLMPVPSQNATATTSTAPPYQFFQSPFNLRWRKDSNPQPVMLHNNPSNRSLGSLHRLPSSSTNSLPLHPDVLQTTPQSTTFSRFFSRRQPSVPADVPAPISPPSDNTSMSRAQRLAMEHQYAWATGTAPVSVPLIPQESSTARYTISLPMHGKVIGPSMMATSPVMDQIPEIGKLEKREEETNGIGGTIGRLSMGLRRKSMNTSAPKSTEKEVDDTVFDKDKDTNESWGQKSWSSIVGRTPSKKP